MLLFLQEVARYSSEELMSMEIMGASSKLETRQQRMKSKIWFSLFVLWLFSSLLTHIAMCPLSLAKKNPFENSFIQLMLCNSSVPKALSMICFYS